MITATVLGANVVLAALLFLFAAWLVKNSSDGLIELGALFSLQLALSYPLRILMLLALQDRAAPSYPDLLEPDALLRTTAVSALGIGSFCAAYFWLRRRAPGPARTVSPRFETSDFVILGLVYAVSLAAKAAKIVTGRYMSFLIGDNVNLAWDNVLEVLQMFGWFVLGAVWLAFFLGQVKRPGRVTFLVGVTTLEMTYQIIQGSKTYLMLPLFIVGLGYFAARRRVPYAFIAAAVAWFCFFVFPFVGAFRTTVTRDFGGIPRFDEFDAGGTMRNAAEGIEGQQTSVLEAGVKALGRFAGADELHNLMNAVPEAIPYRLGRDFLLIPITPIPRALWPGKPVVSIGAEYGQELNTITSVTPFPIGEAYWNGGLVGVVLGMAGWAVFLILVMRLFRALAANPDRAATIYAIFIAEGYWMTTGEASLPMTVASSLKKALFYAAVILAMDVAGHVTRRRQQTGAWTLARGAASSLPPPAKAR